MKRVASLLLVLAITLCGCSTVNEGVTPAEENDVVAEEQDTFVYNADSGEKIPGEEIPLKKSEEEAPKESLEEQEDSTLSNEVQENIVEEEKISQTVYRTKSGEKYHRSGCQYLKKSKIETTVDKAKSMGLKPCSKCHPPQ